jgi:hypothetical protein
MAKLFHNRGVQITSLIEELEKALEEGAESDADSNSVDVSDSDQQCCPHCEKQFSKEYPPGKELSCSYCAARLRIKSDSSVESI